MRKFSHQVLLNENTGNTFTMGMKYLKEYNQFESNEESLTKKMSVSEWHSFESSHRMIKPDDSDIDLYKEFMLDNFSLDEVDNFKNVNYNFGHYWSCDYFELNDDVVGYVGDVEDFEIGNSGKTTIYKFDDEWFVVEHMIKGWHDIYIYWLVDTKDGFKDIKLWD